MLKTSVRCIALFFFTSAILAGCRSANNQPKLLIYTPHGQDTLRDFVARYKQLHPEVDVQFLDMESREVLERLLTKICSRLIVPPGRI